MGGAMGSKDNKSTRNQAGIVQKTALITLILNISLTVLKFVLYGACGSLVVLAEAWHSFSDIATSFMVFIAVRKRKRSGTDDSDSTKSEGEEGTETGADTEKKQPAKISLEQAVSIGIGLFLLVAAISLMGKFYIVQAVIVKNPLIAGLIFLGFSLGSFLVYRLETNVGKEHGSVGLMSDGNHARIDMFASLLTGFSLILYSLGFDIDKLAAAFIALIMLVFALETIVNVVISIRRHESERVFQYKYYTIILALFSPRKIAAGAKFIDGHLPVNVFTSRFFKTVLVLLLILVLLIPLGILASTCVVKVAPSEQAIVERFGKPMQTDVPLEPGLHFKAPWPIDYAVKLDTRLIKRMNIGNVTDPQAFALLWAREHGTEIPFLSGDNNYFYPYLVIHYRIKNLYYFRYKHKEAEGFMSEIGHQVAVKAFSRRTFYEIAIDYRTQMVKDFTTLIQADLDEAETGIEIVAITVKDIHPPVMVSDAYENVIASQQDKEKMINDALGYRNQKVPEARGEASRTRKDAQGYSLDLPLRAEGDGVNFLAKIPDSSEMREITMKRLYLSAMLETLTSRSKVVIDPLAGQPELWLDMKRLLNTPDFEFDKAQF